MRKKKEKEKGKKKKWKNEFVLHELTKAVLNAEFYKIECQVFGALIQRLCSLLANSGGF